MTAALAMVGAILLVSFQNCSKTNLSQISATDLQSKTDTVVALPGTIVEKNTQFSVTSTDFKRMDILFVIDNSTSMKAEQLKISNAFVDFISRLSGLDYRIAITTTDNSGNYQGSKGTLLMFKPVSSAVSYTNNTYFVDKNTLNGNTLFIDTINTGTAGSGQESGLNSIINFVNKSKTLGTIENSFLRPDAAFSTIIVTDSDQLTNSSTFSSAEVFLNQLHNQLPGKSYINHSSIVMPGDNNCRSQGETYGTTYFNLSELTGGVSASICSADYADQFNLIAEVLLTKVSEKTLECAPIDADFNGQLDIEIRNSAGTLLTGYTIINGMTLKFDVPLQIVDTYTAKYKCIQN